MTDRPEEAATMTAEDRHDENRRFGAHLHLRWWMPFLVLLLPPLVMILLQIVLFQAASLVEGGTQGSETVGPLQLLAVNLSMGITGVLTVPVVARMAGAPWRSLLSHPRRPVRRRLGIYLLWALGITVLSNGMLALLAPERTGWTDFAVTGTTIGLLAVIVLTTPLAALAEELMFRGAAMPAVASWVRPERIALALGAVVSAVAFALTHMSTDPWLFGYHLFLGLATAAMAIGSRGLEAPIAFHLANNTFTAVLNALLAGGGGFDVQRTAGAGGPHLLLPAALVLVLLAAVLLRERRLPDRSRTASAVS
ncbi:MULTISPECIES: CPBP family intramembrane glutamic endopeptidase [Brachybacterium]|uniref:CPBP family intramembrane glutamic endopeptidase n=1 Tax=Brachybacterium TaxID=43668 RepID=UPI0006BF224E|nr:MULTISPECIES: CPBP family intramembrane glutamic endopeptidase [Brachybacterium]GAP80051.1 hypothetical protein Y09_2909 [Brachybacterium sp. SW0106-09]